MLISEFINFIFRLADRAEKPLKLVLKVGGVQSPVHASNSSSTSQIQRLPQESKPLFEEPKMVEKPSSHSHEKHKKSKKKKKKKSTEKDKERHDRKRKHQHHHHHHHHREHSHERKVSIFYIIPLNFLYLIIITVHSKIEI